MSQQGEVMLLNTASFKAQQLLYFMSDPPMLPE